MHMRKMHQIDRKRAAMAKNPSLYCPVREQLKAKARSKDRLSFTEEKRRIDCAKYLLSKGYPESRFRIESILRGQQVEMAQ